MNEKKEGKKMEIIIRTLNQSHCPKEKYSHHVRSIDPNSLFYKTERLGVIVSPPNFCLTIYRGKTFLPVTSIKPPKKRVGAHASF